MGSIDEIYKEYLFEKHILVNDQNGKEADPAETLLALGRLFSIRITKGADLVHHDMIRFSSKMLGTIVPEPFYRSFPKGVRELTPTQLLYDQLIAYYITYDLGDMSVPRHSVMEPELEREAFKETGKIRDFIIVPADEAMYKIREIVFDLLAGTRPLSDGQFDLVSAYLKRTGIRPSDIASKNTAIRILLETRDLYYVRFIELSDVIKLVEEMNFRLYDSVNIRKLNLMNRDRKFISKVIDEVLRTGRPNVIDCYEKQRYWTGLLHHIHYKPAGVDGKNLASLMRSGVNRSAYSAFEKAMREKTIANAVDILKKSKGSGAVLRNLNYLISRCETEDDIRYVLDSIESHNTILLLQLYLQYLRYGEQKTPRSFSFSKFGMLKQYSETAEDMKRRRTFLTHEKVALLKGYVFERLRDEFKGRLGKVYIDPDMERYALPLQESTAQSGFGVLTKGSRLKIDDFHKIRGFTYWEKVDDIDLSVIGVADDGSQREFSWRTMMTEQSPAITYSGDITSGYDGGSEYYDVDIDIFRREYPDIRFIVFCDNVYSCLTFDRCVCRAGFMIRDKEDSGEVFEPKTVQSSFAVNCKSMFCYLFAIDIEKKEFVWLNCAKASTSHIAGLEQFWFLKDVIEVTLHMNMRWLFELMATEVCDDMSKAEVIVTDKDIDVPDGVKIIREYDIERITALMNGR